LETLTLLEGILITVTCGWVGWISITMIVVLIKNASAKKDMQALLDRFESVSLELKKDFSKMDSSVETHINRINMRFDVFLKSEIDLLKDMVKKDG
jgi:hypothetical protein